jgi:hypothetical protein
MGFHRTFHSDRSKLSSFLRPSLSDHEARTLIGIVEIKINKDFRARDEIKEAAQVYPFAGKLVMLTPKEIDRAKKDYVELKNLRQKIFA